MYINVFFYLKVFDIARQGAKSNRYIALFAASWYGLHTGKHPDDQLYLSKGRFAFLLGYNTNCFCIIPEMAS